MSFTQLGGFQPLFIHLAYKYNPFESKVAIRLDDLVVHSLFAQRTRKKLHRTHSIQKLGLKFQENMEASSPIYTAFENQKHQLDPSKPAEYISAIKHLALALHRGNSPIKRLGTNAATVLDWMLLAYSMVINPSSAVKIKVARVGSDLGFSIFAARNIRKDEAIYEITGAMPGDMEAEHSELSVITPHEDHGLPDVTPRILFGPARLVNHLCKNFNIELCCEKETVAYYAYAARAIEEGEEITMDYGPNFFKDCPCAVCKPTEPDPSDHSLGKRASKSREETEQEKQAKKRAKRQRQKERREKLC